MSSSITECGSSSIDGTSSVEVDPDRRRQHDSISGVGCRVSWWCPRCEGSGMPGYTDETGYVPPPLTNEVHLAVVIWCSDLTTNISRAAGWSTGCHRLISELGRPASTRVAEVQLTDHQIPYQRH